MVWFKKKPDPISDRARALNDEIARLEAEIHHLDSKLQQAPPEPRLRSTAVPHGATLTHPHSPAQPAAAPPAARAHEPIFEEVGIEKLKASEETAFAPEHYNELGVRKYDLPALLRRWRGFFHGPSTTNPKLVSYLAAGGIQGLRPLRYEKRVARNRFLAAFIIFVFALMALVGIVLWGR
jgi:hypothetical protein